MGRISWDDYFLGIARAVAARADCSRRQVGAVVVGPDHRLVSVGYNGAPSGAPGCLTDNACPRGRLTQGQMPSGSGDYDLCISIHAESNALLYADPVRRLGGSLYCTDAPCPGCLKLIKGSGLRRIVTPESVSYLGNADLPNSV